MTSQTTYNITETKQTETINFYADTCCCCTCCCCSQSNHPKNGFLTHGDKDLYNYKISLHDKLTILTQKLKSTVTKKENGQQ